MPPVTAGPIYPASVQGADGVVLHSRVKLARIGDDVIAWGSANEYPDAEPTDTRGVVVAERWDSADLVSSDGRAWRIVPADPDGEVVEATKHPGCRCGSLGKFVPG